MKTIIAAFILAVATAAAAEKDLDRLYEKAYFLETAKGQTSAALKIYREIASEPVTDENRKVIINALTRMLQIYSGPPGKDLKVALADLNLDFERGPMAKRNLFPSIWSGGGAGYTIVADTDDKRSGNYSCRIRQTGEGNFGTITGTIKPRLLAGRKVKVSGYMKLDGISGMAGLWLRADEDKKPAAFYNMADKKLNGSKGWKHYSFEIDIPEGIDHINFGALMSGSGTLWVDDINIELVE